MSGNAAPAPAIADDGWLTENAKIIRTLGRRVIGDVVEIGRRLEICKARVGYGYWGAWLRQEFDWSEMTAQRFMQINELSKSNNLLDLDLPLSTLYMLAAPSTPPQAVTEVVTRAKAGEHFSLRNVSDVVEKAKAEAKAKPKAAKAESRPKPAKADETTTAKRKPGRPRKPEPSEAVAADHHNRAHKGQVWARLRVALGGLTSLPAADDAVVLMRKTPRVPPLIDAKLDRATAWLVRFQREWSKPQ